MRSPPVVHVGCQFLLVILCVPVNGLTFPDAARSGNLSAIQAILTAGQDPNTLDEKGETALVWAVFNGYTEVVDALLAWGVLVNKRTTLGDGPVIYAAARGH